MSSNFTLNNGLQQIRSSVQRFHRNDSGQSTMEIILMLLIAGLIMAFLTDAGKDIQEKVSASLQKILNFSFEWKKE